MRAGRGDACEARRIRAPYRTWICSLVPAVMLEMVQHASFLIDFLWLLAQVQQRRGNGCSR